MVKFTTICEYYFIGKTSPVKDVDRCAIGVVKYAIWERKSL
jgi:hypothetical protein